MIPYTYLLKCIPENKYYYGVKFGKDSDPNLFWVKYFTSSKIVKELIKKYGVNAFEFEIRKIFKTSEEAVIWERKVLKRLKVVYKENWLNLSDSKAIPSMCGENNPMKRIDVKEKHRLSIQTKEYKNTMSKIKSGFRHSDETKKKISIGNTGKGINKHLIGTKLKQETKDKMKESCKNRKKLKCDKCLDEYTVQNFSKHYNFCNGIKRVRYKKVGEKVRRTK